MKKLIFTGCSYTYGSGIEREYPSKIKNEFIPHHYNIKNCTYEQLEFIHQNRFSKLVADMFETTDLNNGRSGGDIDYALNEIQKHFDNGESSESIAAIIFQIPALERGASKIYSKKRQKWIELYFQDVELNKNSEIIKMMELIQEYDIE